MSLDIMQLRGYSGTLDQNLQPAGEKSDGVKGGWEGCDTRSLSINSRFGQTSTDAVAQVKSEIPLFIYGGGRPPIPWPGGAPTDLSSYFVFLSVYF